MTAKRTRVWHLAAGLAGVGVTVARAILGGLNEYTHIASEIIEPRVAATLTVGWHALTAAFLIAAIALLVGSRLERPAARLSGFLAAVMYGSTAALFLVIGAYDLGNAFAMFQWIPLSIAAMLALAAAMRA